MKKILLGVLVLTVCIAALFFLLRKNGQTERIKQGNKIVMKVESFREKNGRLPANLSEIGLPESEEGPLYYSLVMNGSGYTISFPNGSSLGESTVYSSETKKWE